MSIGKFIADRCVSWVIELIILGVIAFFTISEVQKTNEQTREMLARYDAAITKYATEKSAVIDNAASAAAETIKGKSEAVNMDNAKTLIREFVDKKKAHEEMSED